MSATASTTLDLVIRERMKAGADWVDDAKGLFYERAPSKSPLPYSTFVREPGIPVKALRTTTGWRFKVQIKHWGDDKNGKSAIANTQGMNDATLRLFHARDDDGNGTNCQDTIDELNALSKLNGWQFANAEVVTDIPPYLDKIGDAEVWCQGHRFEFELQFAG